MSYNRSIDWISLTRNIYVDCHNYESHVWFDVCMCINKKKSKMSSYAKSRPHVNLTHGINLPPVHAIYIKFITQYEL